MQTSPSSWKSIGRRLIAALWTDGRVFNGENLRLITPHLDRALRLQPMSALSPKADIGTGPRITFGARAPAAWRYWPQSAAG
jgi:hypothetical protein